jgi:glycosyltransferase involved in cell wall biosynthesis
MYPPHHLGGYELSCRDTVDRWRARGHEVSVLTSDLRLPGVGNRDDPAVGRDLRFYWADHEIVRPAMRERVRIERHNARVLADALQRTQPDVVSFWHMGAMSLSLITEVSRRGVPMVFVVCDDWLLYGPRADAWTSAFAGRPALARVAELATRVPARIETGGAPSAYLFNSDFIRKRAIASGRWPIERSDVVYTGIDLGDFPIATTQPKPWQWRLLCVGRVEERKGVHVAVRALAELPSEATLAVVGPPDGGYRTHLEALANELGVADRVHFEHTTRAELRARYTDADALLFPVVWDEPFGLVPVEAMACGTPVVGSATGGSSEFLLDGINALVTPAGDARALAAGVERLAREETLRLALVANGIETAKALTVDRLADDLERWHVAAARRFTDGEPDPREPLSVSLSALRSGSKS